MATSYKKLWHILVDRELKKKDLQEMAQSYENAEKQVSTIAQGVSTTLI